MQGVDATNAPGPNPIRAIYGFVLFLGTMVAYGVYLLWAFLPEEWLHQLGLTYLPDRHWVFSAPTYAFVGFAFFILLYVSYNFTIVAPLDDMRTIRDSHSLDPEEDHENVNKHGIPRISDMHIAFVNRHLYGSDT
eukprot:m.20596 g.20596  ORF g.20596 m.20596 type:complete len:135 (+) comp28038_c0_seq2:144-548(+)